MNYLQYSKLIFFILCCLTFQGHVNGQNSENLITVFDDVNGVYLYKNKINLYGHYFSGVMLIKPTGNSNYKVAITTEFGAKILEFEIKNGRFILHNSLEEMNKKKILKVIESDMQLFFGIHSGELKELEINNGIKVVETKNKKYRQVYKADLNVCKNKVNHMEFYRKKKKLVEIDLMNYKDNLPMQIEIKHVNIPISIELNYLNHTGNASK